MILDTSQTKPLLPFTVSAYPPSPSHSSPLSSSTRSSPSRSSSPPPFARQSSKQIAKAAFSGRRRLGFLLATVLWLYLGASWYSGRRLPSLPSVASWVPAAPAAGLKGVVHAGAGVFAPAAEDEAGAEEVVEAEVVRHGLTMLGPVADEVYKLDRPSLAGYQATLEQFLIDHFPPEDSDADDPDSLLNAMRRFFPADDEATEPPAIPAKLFQTAPDKEPYSKQNILARASWEKLNPGYDYLIADDKDMHQWVQERFALSQRSKRDQRRVKRQADMDEEEEDEQEQEQPEEEEVEEEEDVEEITFVTDEEEEADFTLSEEADIDLDDMEGVITFEDPIEGFQPPPAKVQVVEEEEVDALLDLEDDLIDPLEDDEEWADPPSQGHGIAAAWNAMAHPPVLRADFWRYLVLAVEGGYYADVDVTCLKPMDQWGLNASMGGVAPDGFVFPSLIVGVEADVGDRTDWQKWYPRPLQFSQWAMASARGHPVLIDVLRRIVETTFASFDEEVAYMATKAVLLDAVSPAIETNVVKVKQRQDAIADAKPPFRSVMSWTGPGPWTDAVLEYVGVRWGVQWADFRSLGEDGWRGGPDGQGDVKVLSITGFSPGVNHMGSKDTTHRAALAKHAFAGSWTQQDGARNPENP